MAGASRLASRFFAQRRGTKLVSTDPAHSGAAVGTGKDMEISMSTTSSRKTARRKLPQWGQILVAMVLGMVAGYLVFNNYSPGEAEKIAGYFSLLSDVFLRLIKMLIGPLVFSTLVVGIAHMGDAKSVGRVFFKVFGWFVIASVISLLLGTLVANLLQPGHDLNLPLPAADTTADLKISSFTLHGFITHLVPKSFIEALAHNEILQIVVFSMFFGVALAALGDIGQTLRKMVEELVHVMLKITAYVMLLAPLAVFGAMAATIATNGLGILGKFAVFIAGFYGALLILLILLVLAGFIFLGRRIFKLLILIREAFLLSFATASSEASYPKIFEALDRFGVKRNISSFVLRRGECFSLVGARG
jgi:Na+/H+-dicarboxylate symporter